MELEMVAGEEAEEEEGVVASSIQKYLIPMESQFVATFLKIAAVGVINAGIHIINR